MCKISYYSLFWLSERRRGSLRRSSHWLGRRDLHNSFDVILCKCLLLLFKMLCISCIYGLQWRVPKNNVTPQCESQIESKASWDLHFMNIPENRESMCISEAKLEGVCFVTEKELKYNVIKQRYTPQNVRNMWNIHLITRRGYTK